jgi:hypothetical protein
MQFFTGNTQEKRKPLGKTRRRYGDNITMHFEDIAREGVDWIYLTHGMGQ